MHKLNSDTKFSLWEAGRAKQFQRNGQRCNKEWLESANEATVGRLTLAGRSSAIAADAQDLTTVIRERLHYKNLDAYYRTEADRRRHFVR